MAYEAVRFTGTVYAVAPTTCTVQPEPHALPNSAYS